jgi:hypothetical protein
MNLRKKEKEKLQGERGNNQKQKKKNGTRSAVSLPPKLQKVPLVGTGDSFSAALHHRTERLRKNSNSLGNYPSPSGLQFSSGYVLTEQTKFILCSRRLRPPFPQTRNEPDEGVLQFFA